MPGGAHQQPTGPGAPLRVLIVDDSAVARTVLARMLAAHDDIQVVGQAGSAAAALTILAHAAIDIILLDLEMPEVGGLAALPDLIAQSGGARVLIVSSACADGAAATLEALSRGAVDTLLKPGAAAFAGRFAEELADRLRRIAKSGKAGLTNGAASADRARLGSRSTTGPAVPRRLECLAIGASTGGVHALSEFFAQLPRGFVAPILVTQHLPPPFMPFFADQLHTMTGRPTRVAEPGMLPAPGEILLAPGHAHLTLVRTGSVIHVRLDEGRVPSGCRPSVDPMFESIGRVFGPGAVGVVLSGMGRDGARGAEALVGSGGAVLAQDAATSVVWGMPGAIANAGLARMVAPPSELARCVAGWSEAA